MLEARKFDVVESFHYLGDESGPGDGCELATIARMRAAWGRFQELLPLLSSARILFVKYGMLFNSWVRELYFMQVNVGLYGEKVLNVYWEIKTQCYAGFARSKLKKMLVCIICTDDKSSTLRIKAMDKSP